MVTQPNPPKKRDATQDLIADVLSRLHMACAPNKGVLTPAIAQEVEKAVRQDWGGDSVFIARANGRDHSERNSRIMREYLQGERLALLGRRHQLSERRILQIIKTRPK